MRCHFRQSRPSRGLTGKGDLVELKTRLVADHGAGAALALQAVAHGDARWFTLNRELKLSAAAGGASVGHRSTPWLSISAESKVDLETMHRRQRNRARFPLLRESLNRQHEDQFLRARRRPSTSEVHAIRVVIRANGDFRLKLIRSSTTRTPLPGCAAIVGAPNRSLGGQNNGRQSPKSH